MNKILKIMAIAGLSAYSASSFSLSKKDIALDAPFAKAPQAVFFTQENGQFAPKCQISVERYPEILPPQLAKEMNNRPALTNQNSALDLEPCGPKLSLSLANEIKSGFKPEIAAVGITSVVSLAACAGGAWLTYKGAYYINREEEKTKTKGYLLTTIGGLWGASLGASIPQMLFKGAPPAWTRWMGGYIGAICSVFGGFVGFLDGSFDRDIADRIMKSAKKKKSELDPSLFEPALDTYLKETWKLAVGENSSAGNIPENSRQGTN